MHILKCSKSELCWQFCWLCLDNYENHSSQTVLRKYCNIYAWSNDMSLSPEPNKLWANNPLVLGILSKKAYLYVMVYMTFTTILNTAILTKKAKVQRQYALGEILQQIAAYELKNCISDWTNLKKIEQTPVEKLNTNNQINF